MLFSSLVFLFTFLPITLLVYYLVPRKVKNVVLLIASLIFYAWGEPVYIFLMLISILFNYFCGMDIALKAGRKSQVRSLIFTIVVNLFILGFFKYYGFIVTNLNAILPFYIPYRKLELPIGISFYTFQTLSYIIDVYRGNVDVQVNLIDFGTYVTMFPQLIAGPIVQYADVERQLRERKESLTMENPVVTIEMENGGKIILHNTGAVTADSAFIANGAGSSIKADGLTNITVGSGDAVKADAGSIELAGGTVKGDVTADNKGKISINANNNAAGSILTDITGNVLAAAGSNVDIGLGTAESKLTGDVSTVGDAVINIYADMGIWTGNADGDNVNLHLNSSKAQWNNIGNSKLRSLKGNGGIINQTDANAGNIDVGDYSGNVVVNYKHTADKDTASNTLNNIKFGGGSLNIDKAAEGSSITLRTDNSDNLSYTETDNIEKLFRELSKKLYYADAGSNPDNLSGHVEIAEGLTKVKVYGDINYGEHGQGNYKDGSIKRTDPEIIYGSSETAMMRGAKSAMASTALLWRSENSDMLQRMGDVRLANEESGLWARYYGGKNSFDAKNTKYSTSFNAYQLGYDKQLDNNKLFGAAVSYNKGKNTYEMGGHGDGKAVSLSVYGSWNSDKGHYADVIVKGGKLDNDYTVYNDMGHKLEGDYDTWGLSLSAEYGRRMQMQNGFYIDPSVQFNVGRVAGADYSAASDFLDSKGLKKDMYVSQDAFTSAIGRIGLGMGKTTDKAMFYTKFALAHEFSGDFTTTFAAENEPTSSTAVDFGGTWFEWQLGGSMKVNDNSYVYATFEKKFGGDTGSNDWRLDAGLRWSF